MPDASSPSRGAAVSRRTLLRAVPGAGVTGLLASCSRMAPGAGGSGSSTPGSSLPAAEAPLTPYADLAAELTDAATDFAALAAMPGVPPATAGWAVAAAAMCRAQAGPLRLPDPLSGTVVSMASPGAISSGSPSPTPTTAPTLVSRLAAIATRQRGLEAQFRTRCLGADASDLALLLGSLAVAAHAVRGPSVPVTGAGVAPAHIEVGSRTDALVVLLSRVEALAQGLEAGIGALPGTDGDVATGEKRLSEVWALRDDIESRLVQASATPTPGPLVYDLPGTTGSDAAVRALWGRLESDVLAAWLRVAAASSGPDRTAAVDAATAQQDRTASLGTPITWWPGWV